MPFQSLYRRYRPRRFAELLGQEHVVTALRNAVREGRVGHAYLFSGPRGTGKTTTARILAKALNCIDLGADGDPCGVCETCTAIAAGTFPDLVEMDAASNRRVEDVRDLISRVSLGLSAAGRRKVYILDEVHMLTTDASNTLLKSLEEPPEHVVFVLATTESEKVLPTIRSRAQHFEFMLYPVEQIIENLASVLDREGIGYEPDALAVIARVASGSMRDSLSLLDQALAHADGPLTAATAEAVFAGTPFGARVGVLEAIAAHDVAGSLAGLAALLEAGHDARRVAEDLLHMLRDAFLLVAGRDRVRVDVVGEERAQLNEIGEALGQATLVRALETLGQAIVDMRGTDAADPRLVLEIAVVRLARRDVGPPLQVLAERVERLEQAVASGGDPTGSAGPPPGRSTKPALGAFRKGPPGAPTSSSTSETPREPSTLPAPSASAPAPPAPASAPALPAPAAPETPGDDTFDLDDVIVAWDRVLSSLPRGVRSAVQEAQPLAVTGNVVTFGVSAHQIELVKPRFQREAQTIREAFVTELGRPPRFKFTVHDFMGDGGGPRRRARAAPEIDLTPVGGPAGAEESPEIVDPDDVVPGPPGPTVDSPVARLEDVFGATVVEDTPR